MGKISIATPQEIVPVDRKRMREVARAVLDGEGVADSYRDSTTPVTFSAGLIRLATSAVVSNSLPMPCRARKCGWSGMKTSLAADRALSVSTPSDGAQSMHTKSNDPSSCNSRSRRITSRPTTPANSTSAAARLMSEAASHRLSATLRRTSASGREWTSTSYIDGDLPSGSMPRWVVAWAWGSRSMTQTRRPHSARAAARLTAVVVLPTPPF